MSNTKVMDLVPYLIAIQEVKTSKLLSSSQRIDVLKEMHYELPPELYCNSSVVTRKLVQSILEDHIDGKGKKEEAESPTQRPKVPKEVGSKKEKQLLLDPDVNTRGKGAKKRVVNKTAQKRRQAEGST